MISCCNSLFASGLTAIVLKCSAGDGEAFSFDKSGSKDSIVPVSL